jgi:CheY-like chemotaxis protein
MLSSPANSAEPPTKGRILVVDDYPSVLVTLEYFLPTIGYAVVTAPDGPTGLEIAGQGGVDLILLDFDMPFMAGIAVCEAIRNNPALRHIPVIMITGRASREAVERGLAAGARAVVTKPFDFRFLESLIVKHLHSDGAA